VGTPALVPLNPLAGEARATNFPGSLFGAKAEAPPPFFLKRKEGPHPRGPSLFPREEATGAGRVIEALSFGRKIPFGKDRVVLLSAPPFFLEPAPPTKSTFFSGEAFFSWATFGGSILFRRVWWGVFPRSPPPVRK